MHSSSDDPIYSLILGAQLIKKREFERSRILLEKAYRHKPTSLQFALSFGKILFILKEYKLIIEVLTPFLMEKKYEVLELLPRSYHSLGEFNKAIYFYREYISHFGTSFFILSLLGDCYYQLGDKEEALKAWENSLELNPNQEDIKKLVNLIKRKKNK